MLGLILVVKIRDYDNLGKIVFVIIYGELFYLMFMYKVEVLDYIIKDNKEYL